MSTLSLCMIVKNEERYIGKCLESMKDIADEIIIVDTGSTDKTKAIVRKYTDKIYDFKWINDFAAARNYSFSKATKDYVMWLDADDVILKEDREKLKVLKNSLNIIDKPISMTYDYAVNNQGVVTLSLTRTRIVKRGTYKWEGFVHEIMPIAVCDTYKSDVHVTHTRNHSNGDRNLKLFRERKKSGIKFSARDTLYYAKELYYNAIYDEAIAEFINYFSQPYKWIEDEIDALIKMADIYKQKGDIVREREYLCKTFNLSVRAEALFPLGMSFYDAKQYDIAAFFFNSILTIEFPKDCDGFLNNDMWGIKPIIQLSCCYYYLGQMEKGKKYHKKAKEMDPTNPVVLFNDQFFK